MAAWLVAACGGATQAPEPMRLASFSLLGERRVLLNQALAAHFTEDLDPSSVTPASVRVLDREGHPASGKLAVLGATISFHPDLPREPDLSDAGLLPDRDYRFVLLGFPSPDGLRSRASLPLEQSLSLDFHTVPAEEPEMRATFEDASLDRAFPLELLTERIGPYDPVRLRCGEGLHPGTVRAEDFQLREWETQSEIPLRARLSANAPHEAVLELQPVKASGGALPLRPGLYHLVADPRTLALRDLGGNPVIPAWPYAEISVSGGSDDKGALGGGSGVTSWWSDSTLPLREAETRYVETFLSDQMRAPLAVPDADGTAAWEGTGVVTIGLPAAAGDGSDLHVELGERESRAEIAAVALTVPYGQVTRIEAGLGLVVYASQGSLTIAGDLVREAEALPFARRGLDESHSAWLYRLRQLEDTLGQVPLALRRRLMLRASWVAAVEFDETKERRPGWPRKEPKPEPKPEPDFVRRLSDWLAEARADDPAWTVLIAGGDIVISGSVTTDTPLILIAGGWVRVLGRVEAREVWLCRHGGGQLVAPLPSPAPLWLDAPEQNPLAESLTWAVLSKSWRPPGGVARWLPARTEGRLGGGRYTVSFLGERLRAGGRVETHGPVADPAELVGCDAVRIRIELTMPPGGLWLPPLIDSVELAWEAPRLEADR